MADVSAEQDVCKAPQIPTGGTSGARFSLRSSIGRKIPGDRIASRCSIHFDFGPLRGGWGYWFLICGNHTVDSAVFVSYGTGFAEMLGLPRRPITYLPCIEQIPVPYRAMFSTGCSRVSLATSPVTLDGTFRFERRVELYRAVFMPIMLRPNWSKQLILGSFNRRELGAV